MFKNQEKNFKNSTKPNGTINNVEKQRENRQKYLKTAKILQTHRK